MDTTTVIAAFAIAVPVIAALAAGYVKRGRQNERQDALIEQMRREREEDREEGRKVHDILFREVKAIRSDVDVIKGRLMNGHKSK